MSGETFDFRDGNGPNLPTAPSEGDEVIRFDVWFTVNWCRLSDIPQYSLPVYLGSYP